MRAASADVSQEALDEFRNRLEGLLRELASPGSDADAKDVPRPRSGWHRRARDLWREFRDLSYNLRKAAKDRDYRYVMDYIIPTMLTEVTKLVELMYPLQTSKQRWMLLMVAQDLVDLVEGSE